MQDDIQETAPAREEKRPQAASRPDASRPGVIRVGVARVPSFSLTRTRRRPGT